MSGTNGQRFDLDGLNHFTPDLQRRILLTIQGEDTDVIPKVLDAGEIDPFDSTLQIMHNGLRVLRDGYDGSWMTEIIRRLRGHHEPQEELVFFNVLARLHAEQTKNPSMIELGSYWSYYTAWFLKEFPLGSAHCVEPSPANLAVGRRNLELNSLRASFDQSYIGLTDNSDSYFTDESTGHSFVVPMKTLLTVVEESGFDTVDILHLDIQGAEYDALLGGQSVLRSGRVRYVFISTHHASISSDDHIHVKCVEFLTDCGAHIIASHTIEESFSGDGLIVASFSEADSNFKVAVSRAKPWESLFSDYYSNLRREVEDRRLEVVALNELAERMRIGIRDAAGSYDDLRAAHDDLRAAHDDLRAAHDDLLNHRDRAQEYALSLESENSQIRSSLAGSVLEISELQGLLKETTLQSELSRVESLELQKALSHSQLCMRAAQELNANLMTDALSYRRIKQTRWYRISKRLLVIARKIKRALVR